METVAGLAISRGFVAGPAFLYRADNLPNVPERTVAPEAVDDELARFQAARATARAQLTALIERLEANGTAGAEADVFANHLALFDDVLLVAAVERNIREGHVNAEAAVHRAMGEFRDVFARMTDAYLRERASDLDDIERRILRVLTSTEETTLSQIDHPVIIVADDLTPSETVTLPRDFVLGFATDRGSTTSHVALLARALGIPAVAGLGNITSRVHTGETILLDGTNGAVTLDPDEATWAEFERMIRRSRELYSQLVDGPPSGVLKDGTPITLRANVQPGVPLCGLATFGAEGIGLYRSEYLWLGEDDNPSEEKQTKVYSEAARAVAGMGAGARVIFRTLDLGGDKLVNGTFPREANPFLGCRSIRWLLSHRDVFRAQLRAILRASAFGPSSVMYPMIATRDELRAANEELARAKDELRAAGVPYDADIPHGCMVEVPSAALAADQLAREVDFFSIGTNDLVQYTLAADRGNEQVAYLYQPAHPAVIKLIDMTVAAAKARGIPVAVCGESAADPVLAALWIGLGVSSLSMGASGIPVVKKVLRGLSSADVAELADKVRAMCADSSAADIYAFCRTFLLEKVPDFEAFQA